MKSIFILVFCVQMSYSVEEKIPNINNDTEHPLGDLWFNGLVLKRTQITPLKFGQGANYIYLYREIDLMNITCESSITCDEKEFKFFNASSGTVKLLNTSFNEYDKIDGSSLFCTCYDLKNKTVHSIMLKLKLEIIAKPFFTGLNPSQYVDGIYSYQEGEFLNIGCESKTPVETKRFMFYDWRLPRYKHLFHSHFQAVANLSLQGCRLHCVYETPSLPEVGYLHIQLKFRLNPTRLRDPMQPKKSITFTDIIIIVSVGTVLLILLFVVDMKIILDMLPNLTVVCKSAWKNTTVSLAQLGTKMRRKKTTTDLAEKWTKLVKVEMHADKDASIIPIISIEKVRYTEFSNTKLSSPSAEYILPVDNKWELPRYSLTFGDILGEGEFGRVMKAEYAGTSDSRIPGVVAVKMLKEEHSDSDMAALVSEMEIMKIIGKHENVVNLLGCCSQEGPLCVVVEYASNGCLREFLNKHNPKCSPEGASQLDGRVLVGFALQVTKGMEFLVSRGCVHRDLAARNVLVSEDLTIKIADFGLARDVRDYAYYRKLTAGRLPVRWMAPESLENNYYTEHSDVWSFGVLFWEIMTFGCTPYRKLPVHFLYDYLKSGNRLAKPDICREIIYSLMLDCWKFDPEERPRFSSLVVRLQEILNETEL